MFKVKEKLSLTLTLINWK